MLGGPSQARGLLVPMGGIPSEADPDQDPTEATPLGDAGPEGTGSGVHAGPVALATPIRAAS